MLAAWGSCISGEAVISSIIFGPSDALLSRLLMLFKPTAVVLHSRRGGAELSHGKQVDSVLF